MTFHSEREAVVLLGSQQRARRPGRGAHQRFGARQGLQEHAVGQMRQRPWSRPLCSYADTALATPWHQILCCDMLQTSRGTIVDTVLQHWLLLMLCPICRPQSIRTKDEEALLLYDDACLPGNPLPHGA